MRRDGLVEAEPGLERQRQDREREKIKLERRRDGEAETKTGTEEKPEQKEKDKEKGRETEAETGKLREGGGRGGQSRRVPPPPSFPPPSFPDLGPGAKGWWLCFSEATEESGQGPQGPPPALCASVYPSVKCVWGAGAGEPGSGSEILGRDRESGRPILQPPNRCWGPHLPTPGSSRKPPWLQLKQ